MAKYIQGENPSSFEIEISEGTKLTFAIPEQITNWQLGKFLKFTGGLLRGCTGAGNAITNLLISLASTMSAGATEEEKKQAASQLVQAMVSVTGQEFGGSMATGLGEVTEYIGENNLLQKLTAVFFLKPNETSIPAKDFDERVSLFDVVPYDCLIAGGKDFFGKRRKSGTNTPPPLTTTETTTNSN